MPDRVELETDRVVRGIVLERDHPVDRDRRDSHPGPCSREINAREYASRSSERLPARCVSGEIPLRRRAGPNPSGGTARLAFNAHQIRPGCARQNQPDVGAALLQGGVALSRGPMATTKRPCCVCRRWFEPILASGSGRRPASTKPASGNDIDVAAPQGVHVTGGTKASSCEAGTSSRSRPKELPLSRKSPQPARETRCGEKGRYKFDNSFD